MAKRKKSPRKVINRNNKLYTIRGIELTRCSNTKTEAEFFSWILSHCRRLTLKWKPANDCLMENREPYNGSDKRTKWQYICQHCTKRFKRKDVHLDHIIKCGGINCFDDISKWFQKALVEKDGYQVLCSTCHAYKTGAERIGLI